jgi:hypothetical protein
VDPVTAMSSGVVMSASVANDNSKHHRGALQR